MEKKNSLPVVMQFISDFVTADKSDLQQMNVEERTAALADILSKPVSSLPGTKIEKLCPNRKGILFQQQKLPRFSEVSGLADV